MAGDPNSDIRRTASSSSYVHNSSDMSPITSTLSSGSASYHIAASSLDNTSSPQSIAPREIGANGNATPPRPAAVFSGASPNVMENLTQPWGSYANGLPSSQSESASYAGISRVTGGNGASATRRLSSDNMTRTSTAVWLPELHSGKSESVYARKSMGDGHAGGRNNNDSSISGAPKPDWASRSYSESISPGSNPGTGSTAHGDGASSKRSVQPSWPSRSYTEFVYADLANPNMNNTNNTSTAKPSSSSLMYLNVPESAPSTAARPSLLSFLAPSHSEPPMARPNLSTAHLRRPGASSINLHMSTLQHEPSPLTDRPYAVSPRTSSDSVQVSVTPRAHEAEQVCVCV